MVCLVGSREAIYSLKLSLRIEQAAYRGKKAIKVLTLISLKMMSSLLLSNNRWIGILVNLSFLFVIFSTVNFIEVMVRNNLLVCL